MKGSPEVLATLQAAIGLEATLNEQYRLDSRSLKYLGVKRLKNKMEKFGDDVSDYRRDLLDRLYFLEGSADYTITSPKEQTNVTAIFQNLHALELGIVAPYEQNVQTAMKALDDTTRNMYEHLLKWHQEHISWFEKQLRIIDAIGEQDYIAESL